MSGITFTGEVSLGHLIPLIVIVVGAIAGYATLRAKVTELGERAGEAKAKADGAAVALSDFKLEVARTYVQASALREVKDDLTREIRDIEHVVRGALMSVLGGQPRRGRQEPT